jgi:L-lactate dehydrogenase
MTTLTSRKVAVVGAGAVGSTFAYALAQSGLADEIVLIDKNDVLVRGQVLDLVHGQPFFPAVSIREGSSTDYGDAQVIVITAGAAQRPGETRLELLLRNADIVRSTAKDIVRYNSKAVIIVVSNPVDIMTYVAIQTAGGKRGHIFGSGTVLDSARLRHLISTRCDVDVHNVHAYVLGEHGDTEFAAWSMTNVAGMQIDKYCSICGKCEDWGAELKEIEQQVRNSAYHIIDYKGATYFAVGLALVRITRAVLRGEKSVLTVSTLIQGEFGLQDVCLSVPAMVSSNGIERVIKVHLPKNELTALHASATVLKKAIAQIQSS